MKRRRITLGGISVSDVVRQREQTRERLRKKFEEDTGALDRFLDYAERTGYGLQEVESVLDQHANTDRPALQAFLHGGGHVLDQVRLNQGTYTYMKDSPRDPNFALRYPAETELIMRRLTPGDLMMLHAAQRVSALYPTMLDNAEGYWKCLWQAIYHGIYPDPVSNGRLRPHEVTYDDPWAAATAAFVAFEDSPDKMDWSEDTPARQMAQTFFRRESPYYTGVTARKEHLRQNLTADYLHGSTGRFAETWMYKHVTDEESLWMTACVILCSAVDNYAREITTYQTTLTPWFSFTARVQSVFARQLPAPYQKCETGGVYADTSQNERAARTDGVTIRGVRPTGGEEYFHFDAEDDD